MFKREVKYEKRKMGRREGVHGRRSKGVIFGAGRRPERKK
jgi:hypothetical protein